VFSLYLFLLPLQTVFLLREPTVGGEKWQYGTIGIYATDILLVVLLCFLFGKREPLFGETARFRSRISRFRERLPRLRSVMAGERDLRITVLAVSSLVFLSWSGLSVLWAPDKALAAYSFIRFLLAAGVFLVVHRSVRDGNGTLVIRTLVIAVLSQAVIGIGQFVTQETFSSVLLGISDHPAWQAGSSVLKNGSGRWLRAYGTLPHPNVYGLLLGVGLLLVFSELTGPAPRTLLRIGKEDRTPSPASETTPRRFSVTGYRTWSLVLLSAIPVLCLGLVLSFSRLAWAGFAIGLATSLVVSRTGTGGGEAKHRTIIPLSVLLLSAAVFAAVLHETVLPRFDGVTIARERSVTDRMTTFSEGWELFRSRPWTGVGAGNHTAALMDAYPNRPVWDIQPAHSVPILVLSELGIPGFAAFSILLVGYLVTVVTRGGVTALPMTLLLLPGLATDHLLLVSHVGPPLLAVLAGYALASRHTDGRRSDVRVPGAAGRATMCPKPVLRKETSKQYEKNGI